MERYKNGEAFIASFTDEERGLFKDWMHTQYPHINEDNVIMGESYDMMLKGCVAGLRIANETADDDTAKSLLQIAHGIIDDLEGTISFVATILQELLPYQSKEDRINKDRADNNLPEINHRHANDYDKCKEAVRRLIDAIGIVTKEYRT